MDKVAAYSFLTSAGCSISKDVHEWLREKLYEQLRNSIQTEKIKSEIKKYTKIRNCQTYTVVENSNEVNEMSKEFNPKDVSNERSRKTKNKPIIEIKKSAGLQCNNCNSFHITLDMFGDDSFL
ncbi:predicted protein [Naegleria gruberi]|uniref:Predicted protein n=1 Tax=Naegleria gruberi TaxID=5762 RepID=D2W4V8_NAEGR|nr:uncharacterized protein NAEGRDRAFT_76446 [Naegleria gruberi]EFC35891.1 predicted protein [Naegleria gruberi]|eukprot:XP_002668635.1 predicted protein [Naegleria gruberi strain NEG-M]